MRVSRQIQNFLDARRLAHVNRKAFRSTLLKKAKSEVLAEFEARLQLSDEEKRAEAIEGLTLLYGVDVTDFILRWIDG